MEAWLSGAIDKGGVFALAVMAIYFLNKLWRDRLEAEKFYRQALEQQYARDKEELTKMWNQTWEALENNTRVFTILMERMGVEDVQQPASKIVLTRPRKKGGDTTDA